MIFNIIGRDEALQKESAKVAELEQLCARLEYEKRALMEASGGAHAAAAAAMHYHSTAVQQCPLDEEVRESTHIVYMCLYILREGTFSSFKSISITVCTRVCIRERARAGITKCTHRLAGQVHRGAYTKSTQTNTRTHAHTQDASSSDDGAGQAAAEQRTRERVTQFSKRSTDAPAATELQQSLAAVHDAPTARRSVTGGGIRPGVQTLEGVGGGAEAGTGAREAGRRGGRNVTGDAYTAQQEMALRVHAERMRLVEKQLCDPEASPPPEPVWYV